MMQKTYIIAEAGVNHNGDINIAKKLIDCAALAGADAVKFQSFHAGHVVQKNTKKAEYQMQATEAEETQYDMLRKLELTVEMHEELIEHCKLRKIQFLSTPFDNTSVDYLVSKDVPLIKVPSGEITNYPYLVHVAKTGRPVIMSTGMSTLEEIEEALAVLRKNGTKEISILHCNTEYPTPISDANVLAIKVLKEKFLVPVGYSDHTQGIEASVAAVALGATIIEKHFTLDKGMEGPDQQASLSPEELLALVKAIREVELALGKAEKQVTDSERKNIVIARRSIVSREPIKKGELFTEANLTTKRPADGINPMKWEQLIGLTADREYAEDEQIIWPQNKIL